MTASVGIHGGRFFLQEDTMDMINLAFATPLFRVTLTGVEDMNSALETLILSLEDGANRKSDSPQGMHRGVFESDFNFLNRKEPEVQELKNIFFNNLGAFVKEINQLSDAQLAELKFHNHCWFHITRSGGYFQPHNHPNASWSIVYYVNPGDEQVEEARAAGHIVFNDPRPQASCYLDPANDNMRREFSFSAIRIRPQRCEMLIFPSYLFHYVEPYECETPRIVVASNFWFHR